MTNAKGSEAKVERPDWSIQEVARLAGVTSRTLRHYDAIGLLPPSRVGANGHRRYDQGALTRLQRILLLRELGLGLGAIAEVLEGERDDRAALEVHLKWLVESRRRLEARIEGVRVTIDKLERGEPLMAKEMLQGFDHSHHRTEVETRWGKKAWKEGDLWWRGTSEAERSAWGARAKALIEDWCAAAGRGEDPAGPVGQELARRQADWLGGIPGTPREEGRPAREYYLGLAEMYVADERFRATYGGMEGAEFVRAAMVAFAEREL